MVNDSLVRDEIRHQNSVFDLHKFYDGGKSSGYNYGGLYFITRNQDFYCFSRIKHEYAIENIYSSIFDNFYDIFKINDYDYRRASEDLGVICMQLISRYYSIIWMPYKINIFQKQKFLEFYKKVNDVNNNLKNNGYDVISFGVNFVDDRGNMTYKTFDEAASIIDDYVSDDLVNIDEYLLNDDSKKRKVMCNISKLG